MTTDTGIEVTAAPQVDASLAKPRERLAGPWARYWARKLDVLLMATILSFVAGMLFPALFMPDSWLMQGPSVLFGLVILPFALAADALVQAVFGTNLGKAIAGIKIRTLDGKRPAFGVYFSRTAELYLKGYALGVPIVSLLTLTQNYHHLDEGRLTPWDNRLSTRVYQGRGGLVRTTVAAILGIVGTVGMLVLEYASRLDF